MKEGITTDPTDDGRIKELSLAAYLTTQVLCVVSGGKTNCFLERLKLPKHLTLVIYPLMKNEF